MALWGENVIGAAQNRDIALEAWRDALEVALDAGLAVREVKRATGREEFSIGRARYKVVSLDPPRRAWAPRRPGDHGRGAGSTGTGRRGRRWRRPAGRGLESRCGPSPTRATTGRWCSTPWGRRGRAAARSGAATDVAWFEWSAPPGLERTDPEGWRASNPALGRLITMATIASEAAHDPPEVFETEVLCRRVASLRPWLPAGTWERHRPDVVTVPDGAQVVFSLDAGPEGRHASIAVGWRRPDGRVHVEAVDAFAQEQGPVLARAGVRLAELAARWNPYAVVVAARSPSDAAASRALEETGDPGGEAQRRRLDGAPTTASTRRSWPRPWSTHPTR